MSRVSAWMRSALIYLPLTAGVGCSSSETSAPPDAKPVAAAAEQGGPDVAVFEFLKAVQGGNDKQAANMLTKLAREKTAEMEMVVAPPGSDTASFEVGEVQLINEDGAYVSSTWTDVSEGGQSHSDQIVWVCRKEPEGWRIAGMVTKLFDSKLVLNFEDPQDMIRKQQLAEQEMVRRAQQQVTGAPATGNTGTLPPEGQQPGEMREARQPQTGTMLK